MEHRWGERVSVRLTVELSCGAAAPVAGLLENVSSSGAFVRTHGCRLPRGAVEVALVRGGTDSKSLVRLPAYIVRENDVGVGIEWCEFAPRAVRELMARGRRSGARTRARASVSKRRPARESNTALAAVAQPAAIGASTAAVSASFGTELGALRP
ncbi:MAG TPA: PilZ domain-containing protein [Steroidobacteraceae bacterium]|nr:PilZ domain-containing protein [Steroidobacteraceae bacterium]